MIITEPKSNNPSQSKAKASATTSPDHIMLDLAKIRIDGGTQSRAGLNEETVRDYIESIDAGATFPAITVFYDGSNYWLADGFHRHAAFLAAGQKAIAADVRQGTVSNAILHSVGANDTHGLRRTSADKKRSVLMLLGNPEWSGWSDREIARRCHVGHPLVARIKAEMTSVDTGTRSSMERTFTHAKTGKPTTMKTSGINAGRAAAAPSVIPEVAALLAETALDTAEYRDRIAKLPPNEQMHAARRDLALHRRAAIDTGEVPQSESPDVVEAESHAPGDASDEVGGSEVAPLIAANDAADPEEIDQTAQMLVHTAVRKFDTFCKEHTPEFVASGVSTDDLASVRLMVGRLTRWLEAFSAAAKSGGRKAA